MALAATLAPASASSGSCSDRPYLETLRLQVEPKTRTVTRGETLDVLVTVTREPLGDDVRTGAPAAGSDVVVALGKTWPLIVGGATTGEDGKAEVELRIAKNARPGWLDGAASARVQHGPRVCHEQTGERGSWTGERVVRIRP